MSGAGPGAPNLLSSALVQWLEAGLNGALALDGVAEARLARLEGSTVLIVCTSPVEQVTLRCIGSRFSVTREAANAPHVIVRGTPAELLGAFTGLGAPNVAIEGDEVLLGELRSILRDLEPDLTRPLAPLIGKEPAAALAGFAQVGAATLRSIFSTLESESSRAARNRLHASFLDHNRFDAFARRIANLRLATDRLSARIDALERRRASGRSRAP